MIELIEINYYWTMICIFIVGICYSSKSLYVSSHFIMEDEINESSNEDDNGPLPTKTKETISDSIADTSEKRNPKNKGKISANKTFYEENNQGFNKIMEDHMKELDEELTRLLKEVLRKR